LKKKRKNSNQSFNHSNPPKEIIQFSINPTKVEHNSKEYLEHFGEFRIEECQIVFKPNRILRNLKESQ